jgi:hypothetical protein
MLRDVADSSGFFNHDTVTRRQICEGFMYQERCSSQRWPDLS